MFKTHAWFAKSFSFPTRKTYIFLHLSMTSILLPCYLLWFIPNMILLFDCVFFTSERKKMSRRERVKVYRHTIKSNPCTHSVLWSMCEAMFITLLNTRYAARGVMFLIYSAAERCTTCCPPVIGYTALHTERALDAASRPAPFYYYY
jgi:hypothetical protein